SVVLTCTVGELLVKQSQDHPAPGAVRPWTGCDGSQHGSQRRQKGPSTERVGACDLGALGGTRTPSLLIRRLCRAPLRPGPSVAGLPGWYSVARVVFRCCSSSYGQNQTT